MKQSLKIKQKMKVTDHENEVIYEMSVKMEEKMKMTQFLIVAMSKKPNN